MIVAADARAQVDIGQISGTLVDSTKAAIPGIVVTVTNVENHVSRQATTNATGFYSFPNLMVGTYSVSAEGKGFSKYVKNDIHLDAAAQLDVSFHNSSPGCRSFGLLCRTAAAIGKSKRKPAG